MSGQVLGASFVGGDDDLLAHGYAFVGAVHNLVELSNGATKPDLVLAAVSHALREGDKTVEELRAVVHRVWPGARVETRDVTSALALGRELGLVSLVAGLDGTELWQLTPRGVDDVQRQVEWVAHLRERTSRELQSRALSDLNLSITDEQAELWLERIVAALIEGVTASQDAYFGRVDHLVGKRLSPRKVDRARVLRYFESIESEPGVIEFLKASTIAALDPLDPFCDQLVSLITTGCVLHSYVAGREAAPVLEALGRPASQRALIDTPVLLDLIGPTRVSSTVELTIRAAVAAGWEVIVCNHSIDELVTVVTSEIPRIRHSFQQAHDKGIREEWFASLASEQLTSYAVEVLRDKKYSSLEQMIDAASSIASRLESYGVIVRESFNDKDRALVDRCKSALELELAHMHRTGTAIQRDAESMAVVWRRRRREPAGSRWPGGWIITPDRHLATPYESLAPADKVSLSLTLSQWSTLLSITVPVADVVSLAEAAATQLVEEAMWLLPSRFPSEIALELAERLSPERGGSGTDIRYAQMTLDLALDGEHGARTANAIASDVLAARTKRQDQISRQEVESASRAAARSDASRIAAEAFAEQKTKEATSAREEAVLVRTRMASLEGELAWQKERTGRIFWSAAFVAVGAVLIVIAWAIGAWPPVLVGMGAGLAVGVWILYRWCATPHARLIKLLWAASVEVVGLASAIVGLVADLSS